MAQGAIVSDSDGVDKPVALSLHLILALALLHHPVGEMTTDNYHISPHKCAAFTVLHETESDYLLHPEKRQDLL